MTPAERARLIEKQEFEAECEAIRHRAMRALEQRRRDDEARIAAWLGREPAPSTRRRSPMRGRHAKLYMHNGQSKTLTQWSIETGVALGTLRSRMQTGMSFERALTRKPGKQAALYTVNGVSKTLQEWADHIGITYVALLGRMRRCSLAKAVAMPQGSSRKRPGVPDTSGPRPCMPSITPQQPGVPHDFAPFAGTGAGRPLQAMPNITFTTKAENE